MNPHTPHDPDENNSSNQHASDTTINTAPPSLSQRFPTYETTTDMTDEYTTLLVDSPTLIHYLQDDLLNISDLRSWNVFGDVTDEILSYLDSAPSFKDIQQAPQYDSHDAQKSVSTTTFVIGCELDPRMIPQPDSELRPTQQILTDASIVAIQETEPGSVTDSITYCSEQLLAHNYLTYCQVIDGDIYTIGPIPDKFTYHSLVSHTVKQLELRRDLLMHDIQDYKRIYTQLYDTVLNEHISKYS